MKISEAHIRRAKPEYVLRLARFLSLVDDGCEDIELVIPRIVWYLKMHGCLRMY